MIDYKIKQQNCKHSIQYCDMLSLLLLRIPHRGIDRIVTPLKDVSNDFFTLFYSKSILRKSLHQITNKQNITIIIFAQEK